MREIVVDTETTGLDPGEGHRIVEVACLELQNHMPTGRHFQHYVHPERDMPEEAYTVHGLSAAFLADFPVFAEIADAFLEFVGDAPLVIHNAAFDLRFLNAELTRAGWAPLAAARAIDTVALARRRFPGSQVNLDALCRRFEIDNSGRTLHGALLDCELLADVYLELCGGRQQGFDLAGERSRATDLPAADDRPVRPPRAHRASAAEEAAHEAFLARMDDPVWRR